MSTPRFAPIGKTRAEVVSELDKQAQENLDTVFALIPPRVTRKPDVTSIYFNLPQAEGSIAPRELQLWWLFKHYNEVCFGLLHEYCEPFSSQTLALILISSWRSSLSMQTARMTIWTAAVPSGASRSTRTTLSQGTISKPDTI